MNEKQTLSLEELGKVETVKVYNQAYVDKQKKRIAELETQIEKMKCCGNCLYNGECDLGGYEECKNFDKWELKEIKEK